MEFKPLSGREFPRFSGLKTFFRLPVANLTEDFQVGIFGVPFDGGVSYRPGARFAPSSVREVSSLGRGFHWSRGVSIFESLRVADLGDCSVVPIDREQTYSRIESYVAQVPSSKRLIAVGGDHSITLPILRALRKKMGAPLAFIHFDAHLDTYPAAWGEEYHHGSFARHAVEEGLVDPKKMVQIGLRGPLAGGEDLDFVQKHGIRTVTVDEVRRQGVDAILKSLPKWGSDPTYLSYDIDCLDPAYAPGTGTPVVGGLTTYETQQILRGLSVTNLVGADLVEISPTYDSSQITALAGVDALFEMLCLMASRPSP